MTVEQLQYEKGWGECGQCGCRRPVREMVLVVFKATQHRPEFRQHSCADVRWCETARLTRPGKAS